MQILSSLASHSGNFRRRWTLSLSLDHFSSLARQASISNPVFIKFLRDHGFQKPQAISIAKRYPNVKSLEQPLSVIQMLKSFNFSDTQIQKSIWVHPQLLFYNPKKTLEPKLRFFEEIGFSGSDLSKFVSRNISVVSVSLVRKLIPTVEILKTIVAPNNEDLTLILTRCSWLLNRDPNSFLLPNISYLKACGIVGSQLASLLRRQPMLFNASEEKLRDHVSRALDLGFSVNSGMLVHALLSLSSISKKTYDRKFNLLVANGFSEDEITKMIRSAPGLIRCAEDKLKFGMEFYMKKMGIKREALVKRPCVLMHSFEKRVIPRLRVLQILKDKGLLKEKDKKNNWLFEIVEMTEKAFLKKYVSGFGDEIAEELFVGLKVHHILIHDDDDDDDDDTDSSCYSHGDCSLVTDS